MNLILFEWKLIVRNKRLKQLFIISVVLLPLMIYFQLVTSRLLKDIFLIKELFLLGVFAMPANFATLAFCINATFIEKQLIAPFPIYKTLQAKYRLFNIISVALFIFFLPGMFLGVKFVELIASFLFAIGFVYFGFFWTSLSSYKPFDIKASYFYNFQGFDAANYFFPLLVMIISCSFSALLYWLFNETITLIAMSFTGLIFIVTNRIWLEKIGNSFEKTKYRRLERFREK